MKISCIIPSYNEESRIGNVLKVVIASPLIDEIIIVDDGSKDGTIALVNNIISGNNSQANDKGRFRFIVHQKNQGKSAAIVTGIKEAHGEYLLLIDADLIGLTVEDIARLIEPVSNGLADVSISLRENAPKAWHRIGMDYISGERVLPRSLLASKTEKILKLPRFGLEVFINSLIIKNHLKIAVVPWPNVQSPFKHSKYGLWKGIKGDTIMMLDIFRTVTIFGPIYQIYKMRRLQIGKSSTNGQSDNIQLSIIIPAYNEEKVIGPCLEAVIANMKDLEDDKQKNNYGVEIIVVNNASTDRTKEIALSFPGVKVVDENKKGLTHARQAGHIAAQGELEANIDADTIMPLGWVKRVLYEFNRNSNLVAISGPYIYYDMPLTFRVGAKTWYVIGYIIHFVNHRILKTGAMIQGGNFVVRKKAIEKIGGYDTNIAFFGEDTDLARRIQKVGRVKFSFALPMKTTGRRLRGEGVLAASWHYATNYIGVSYGKKPLHKEYKDFRDK